MSEPAVKLATSYQFQGYFYANSTDKLECKHEGILRAPSMRHCMGIREHGTDTLQSELNCEISKVGKKDGDWNA